MFLRNGYKKCDSQGPEVKIGEGLSQKPDDDTHLKNMWIGGTFYS